MKQTTDAPPKHKPLESKDNPFILRKYILVPDSGNWPEHLIALFPPSSLSDFRVIDRDEAAKRVPIVVAVYEPTGRGPFKDKYGDEVWEYEYKGVRIQ